MKLNISTWGTSAFEKYTKVDANGTDPLYLGHSLQPCSWACLCESKSRGTGKNRSAFAQLNGKSEITNVYVSSNIQIPEHMHLPCLVHKLSRLPLVPKSGSRVNHITKTISISGLQLPQCVLDHQTPYSARPLKVGTPQFSVLSESHASGFLQWCNAWYTLENMRMYTGSSYTSTTSVISLLYISELSCFLVSEGRRSVDLEIMRLAV